VDSNQGKGVTLNIKDEQEMEIAYNEARNIQEWYCGEICKGKDYRVLVVGDRVAAVAERRPPFVIGDGVHTVEELVAIENLSSLRGTTMKSPLQKSSWMPQH